jgi:hypothetical protein
VYVKCPVCEAVLRHKRNGLFECPSCEFVGDPVRVLKTKNLQQESETLLKRLDIERELLLDALRTLKTRGDIMPLDEAIKAVRQRFSHSASPAMEIMRDSRKKYALMLASIEVGAFADWLLSNLGSLAEGKVPILQAAFPFMFLFHGAVLLYLTAK